MAAIGQTAPILGFVRRSSSAIFSMKRSTVQDRTAFRRSVLVSSMLVGSERDAIGSLACHGIIGIANRQDSTRDRNIFPLG